MSNSKNTVVQTSSEDAQTSSEDLQNALREAPIPGPKPGHGGDDLKIRNSKSLIDLEAKSFSNQSKKPGSSSKIIKGK